MLGRLDAGDRVVRIGWLMVDPVPQLIGDGGNISAGGESRLAGAERKPGACGGAVHPDEPVQECSPATADVKHAASSDAEAIGKKIKLAMLCPSEQAWSGRSLPPAARVHHVRAQPDP